MAVGALTVLAVISGFIGLLNDKRGLKKSWVEPLGDNTYILYASYGRGYSYIFSFVHFFVVITILIFLVGVYYSLVALFVVMFTILNSGRIRDRFINRDKNILTTDTAVAIDGRQYNREGLLDIFIEAGASTGRSIISYRVSLRLRERNFWGFKKIYLVACSKEQARKIGQELSTITGIELEDDTVFR